MKMEEVKDILTGLDRYEEFLKKLEKSGINVIIEEKQKQLDEWKETLKE